MKSSKEFGPQSHRPGEPRRHGKGWPHRRHSDKRAPRVSRFFRANEQGRFARCCSGRAILDCPGRQAGDRSAHRAVCRPIPGLPVWPRKSFSAQSSSTTFRPSMLGVAVPDDICRPNIPQCDISVPSASTMFSFCKIRDRSLHNSRLIWVPRRSRARLAVRSVPCRLLHASVTIC